ncbi:MAG TPA: hypothetical protein VFD69_18955, partial [Vicinamibacterales bacterium]|nr:hypothetical protein [Vicinamibacterales bacterium]
KAAQTAPIVTTADELEAYEIVRTICARSTLQVPVVYRDTSNWFTISAGTPRKWFMRLYFNQKRKSVITKIPLARATPLVPGFEIDNHPEGSRVYVNDPKDLARLLPLVLLAYEEEVKRKDNGGEDTDPTAST